MRPAAPPPTPHLLDALTRHTWAATRAHGYQPTCCVAAVWILREAARAFGISGRAQPVSVLAANTAALEPMAAHTPAEEWPDGAWSLAVGDTGDAWPGYWDGHLVFVAPWAAPAGLGSALIADPSLPQADRPDKGLRIPGPLMRVLPPEWPGENAYFVSRDQGTHLWYAPLTGPAAGEYRQTQDWGSRPAARAAVADVIRVVRTEQAA